MIDSQIQDLFYKHYNNTITPDEAQKLYRWLALEKNKAHAQKILRDLYDLEMEHPTFSEIDIDQKKLLKNIFLAEKTLVRHSKIIAVRKKTWISVAAAATVIFGLAFFGYHYGLIYNRDQHQLHSRIDIDDLPPGSEKAILTLSNGKQISLDAIGNDQFIEENGIRLSKLGNGLISYTVNPEANYNLTALNTIETPAGGFYQLVLPDGTKVWLNAMSSLKFPHTFSPHERKVQLTGEAYFEVAHDRSKPFEVFVNEVSVRVLGTHFNINSYSKSSQVATTVLEGAVSVFKNNSVDQRKTVYPGNTLSYHLERDKMELTTNVDLSQVIAWKNGFFNNSTISLQDLMEEVSRWYGVDIVYRTAKMQTEFVGKLPKDISLRDLITLLELTGELKFNLTSKTLTIMDK